MNDLNSDCGGSFSPDLNPKWSVSEKIAEMNRQAIDWIRHFHPRRAVVCLGEILDSPANGFEKSLAARRIIKLCARSEQTNSGRRFGLALSHWQPSDEKDKTLRDDLLTRISDDPSNGASPYPIVQVDSSTDRDELDDQIDSIKLLPKLEERQSKILEASKKFQYPLCVIMLRQARNLKPLGSIDISDEIVKRYLDVGNIVGAVGELLIHPTIDRCKKALELCTISKNPACAPHLATICREWPGNDLKKMELLSRIPFEVPTEIRQLFPTSG